MPLTEMIIALGRIVATRVAGTANAVLANLSMLEEVDDDPEAETSTDEPLYGPIGFYARPMPPVAAGTGMGNAPEGTPEFVGLRFGDRVIPLVGRDLRLSTKVNPKEGEVGLVQYCGGFVSLKTNADGDGTDIVVYSVHNTPAGVPDKAHALSFDSTTANSSVVLVHSFGQRISLTKEGHIALSNKQGSGFLLVKDDDDGDAVLSSKKIMLCGAVTAGATNPLDPSVDFVALASKVLAELEAIRTWVNNHVHGGVTTGAGSTAAATPPLGAPGDVGATKLKAV